MDSHLDRSWGHLAHLEDEVPADGLHEQVLLLRAVQVQEDAHEAHEGPERELHAREALVPLKIQLVGFSSNPEPILKVRLRLMVLL